MNRIALSLALSCVGLAGCSGDASQPQAKPAGSNITVKQDTPPPPLDPNNIVSIAAGSKDHTTLVTALKAADYVRSVANPGPLTVFAPTNAAFDKLPAGTVETLLKPEKQADLKEIIKYHAAASTYEQKDLKDGQQLGMANGKKVTIHIKDGKMTVNGANVLASIKASNGVVHVIDAVLLPSDK